MSTTLVIWIIAIVAILALVLWYFLSSNKKKEGKVSPKAPFSAPEGSSPQETNSQGTEGYQAEGETKDLPR